MLQYSNCSDCLYDQPALQVPRSHIGAHLHAARAEVTTTGEKGFHAQGNTSKCTSYSGPPLLIVQRGPCCGWHCSYVFHKAVPIPGAPRDVMMSLRCLSPDRCCLNPDLQGCLLILFVDWAPQMYQRQQAWMDPAECWGEAH